jgi:hypothetical protein
MSTQIDADFQISFKTLRLPIFQFPSNLQPIEDRARIVRRGARSANDRMSELGWRNTENYQIIILCM